LKCIIGILCLLAVVPSAALGQTLIGNVQVRPFVISPNGDGIGDSLTLTYVLNDSASSVYVVVLQDDSTTVVDTLVGGAPASAGTDSVAWDGNNSGGTTVAEGNYVIFLHARDAGTAAADSTWRVVSVDLTPPAVTITGLFPDPFAPGSGLIGHSHLTVQFDINDPHPSEEVVVRARIFNPSKANPVTVINDSVMGAVSSNSLTWDGTYTGGSVEGLHEVRIEATDLAGFRVEVFSLFDVDRTGPTVRFTSPPNNDFFNVMPDSLFGWTWDSAGIAQLNFRYFDTNPYVPVANTWLMGDTLFFAVPLADSLTADDAYVLNFQSVSTTQRETTRDFTITLDTTPPLPPTLTQPMSPTQAPSALINGVDQDPDGALRFRIFQNGVLTDSTNTFPYTATLVPGNNRITATAVDDALNESIMSNEVNVVYDTAVGLFINQPFRPDDSFRVVLPRPASRTTIRIYDLGGQLVRELSNANTTMNVSMQWDGSNGDFETVKRGPLVAVLSVTFDDGSSDIMREIFLFQP
jgi:flagellar hook assembly protein FlgD